MGELGKAHVKFVARLKKYNRELTKTQIRQIEVLFLKAQKIAISNEGLRVRAFQARYELEVTFRSKLEEELYQSALNIYNGKTVTEHYIFNSPTLEMPQKRKKWNSAISFAEDYCENFVGDNNWYGEYGVSRFGHGQKDDVRMKTWSSQIDNARIISEERPSFKQKFVIMKINPETSPAYQYAIKHGKQLDLSTALMEYNNQDFRDFQELLEKKDLPEVEYFIQAVDQQTGLGVDDLIRGLKYGMIRPSTLDTIEFSLEQSVAVLVGKFFGIKITLADEDGDQIYYPYDKNEGQSGDLIIEVKKVSKELAIIKKEIEEQQEEIKKLNTAEFRSKLDRLQEELRDLERKVAHYWGSDNAYRDAVEKVNGKQNEINQFIGSFKNKISSVESLQKKFFSKQADLLKAEQSLTKLKYQQQIFEPASKDLAPVVAPITDAAFGNMIAQSNSDAPQLPETFSHEKHQETHSKKSAM